MSTWHVTALVLLGLAAVAAILLWDADPEPPASDVATATSGGGAGSGVMHGQGPPPSGASRAGATKGAGGASDGDGAPTEALIPFAQRREALMQEIADLGEALRLEREIERVETEVQEQMREEAWSRMIEGLVLKVRADPRQADAMVAKMDTLENEALAIRLARILRRAEHPELLASMRDRVTNGSTPLQRRTAMLVLETRDHDLWLAPVSAAYSSDADATVRDEAAGLLARSLADTKHLSVHNQMRTTIQSGLAAEAPAERIRALRAMIGDRRPRPGDLERAKAMLKDSDAGVRAEAARTVRVLGPQVERALKRRNER